MAAFLIVTSTLFSSVFIFRRLRRCGLVDFFDDLSDGGIYLFVGHYLLGGIRKMHVQTVFYSQGVLLSSIAFAYPSFQQIALYSALEYLFGH